MLLTIALHQPQMLPAIVRATPAWVWGLLAALIALGASQLRDRTAGLARVSAMPVAMTAFSAWGMVATFASSPVAGPAIALWLGVAATVAAVLARGPSAARYDAGRREYHLPGSVVPLLLILGIFLAKWSVGVELSLQPPLVRDRAFTLSIAAVYGLINGLFVGRALRLWRLALRPHAAATA
jgi:hypothetical protein